ncbi:MAG: hypothetical protein ACI85U_003465 [Candidatus Promineifilaceae bacterium]|jgi:hypothetical protein
MLVWDCNQPTIIYYLTFNIFIFKKDYEYKDDF